MLVAHRLYHAEREGGIDQMEFVHGLLDELIAVGQDQGSPATALDQEGKHNGFPRPGGQHEQGPLDATGRRGE
jgi:hypothetical protein